MMISTRLVHLVVASVPLATGSDFAQDAGAKAPAECNLDRGERYYVLTGPVMELPKDTLVKSRASRAKFAQERFRFGLSPGAARGIRTPDPIITNDVLYQLSYCGLGPAPLISAAGGIGKASYGSLGPRTRFTA